MIERGICVESNTQFGKQRWLETWQTNTGYVFILTNFESGERVVYTGDEPSEFDAWLALKDVASVE